MSNGKLHTIKGIQWVEIPLSLVFDIWVLVPSL